MDRWQELKDQAVKLIREQSEIGTMLNGLVANGKGATQEAKNLTESWWDYDKMLEGAYSEIREYLEEEASQGG